MIGAPLTIFSSIIDPVGVLDAVRRTGAKVALTEGTGEGWREATVSSKTGAATLKHHPEYYADTSWSKQLPGMFGYFRRARTEVLSLIRSFRFSVSVAIDEDENEDAQWEAAQAICRHLDGVIFVPGALLDAAGRPIATANGEADLGAVMPRAAPPHPILMPTGGLYDRRAGPRSLLNAELRGASCDELEGVGFAGAYWLPQKSKPRLRPPEEIAARLAALHALFNWVSRLEVAEEELRRFVAENRVLNELSDEDRAAFDQPRQQAHVERAATIGWHLENMWPLAWALGFEPRPSIGEGMIDTPTQTRLERFRPKFDESISDWLAGCAQRSKAEVIRLEDLFYCAHHAVRSAQMGMATVPPDFHPIMDGGVVHERRHALTWMLSPGTTWDETDLST